MITNWKLLKFYTLQNLQDSQTERRTGKINSCFTPFKTYKTLKQESVNIWPKRSFTPYKTYKTLKQTIDPAITGMGFTPFKTYKTLKRFYSDAEKLISFTPFKTYKTLKQSLLGF